MSSPASYCCFITLQHMGSKTRTATSCLQWAGAVTEMSVLLSALMWLGTRLTMVRQVNFFSFFYFFLSFTCNVNVSIAKILNPEEKVSFCILSNILEYTCNTSHKYACNTIVSEIISKGKAGKENLKIILKCVLYIYYMLCWGKNCC